MSDTRGKRGIYFSPKCICTLSGILKIVQLVLDILSFICCKVANYPHFPAANFFLFLSAAALVLTSLLGCLYLCHIPDTFHIPWAFLEMTYCGIVCILYFVCSCILASNAFYSAALGASAFFGYVAMTVYAVDSIVKGLSWRKGKTNTNQHSSSPVGTAT